MFRRRRQVPLDQFRVEHDAGFDEVVGEVIAKRPGRLILDADQRHSVVGIVESVAPLPVEFAYAAPDERFPGFVVPVVRRRQVTTLPEEPECLDQMVDHVRVLCQAIWRARVVEEVDTVNRQEVAVEERIGHGTVINRRDVHLVDVTGVVWRDSIVP